MKFDQEAGSDPTLRPLQEHDFELLGELARTIWLAHYTTIITEEQIEYMLGGRFAPESLYRYLHEDDRWMDVLTLGEQLVGYCSYARTSDPNEMKLEQLYLLPQLHGWGFGKYMLDHVERRSAELGASALSLQVNKLNDKALALYRRAGYEQREEIVVDIGRGFVMDDYVMAKALSA